MRFLALSLRRFAMMNLISVDLCDASMRTDHATRKFLNTFPPQMFRSNFNVPKEKRGRSPFFAYRSDDQPRQEPGRNLAVMVVPVPPQTHLKMVWDVPS
jgi:hypothetical protein